MGDAASRRRNGSRRHHRQRVAGSCAGGAFWRCAAGNAALGGRVDVKLGDLTLKHGRVAAAVGVLRWDRAAVVRPVPAQLGGFELKLEPADASTKGVLQDQGGPVQADGLLPLKAAGKYTITASFVSRDLRQPAIAQGLLLFGQPGADGRVQINSKGVLPPLIPGAG